ncbi:MAG: IS607 family transposase [Firmicutes bacterium]|nr:IS607 family transposase [Bacillota bacterium]
MNQEHSTGHVARRWGVNVRTIYRWEEAGLLHPIRLPNGQRRFFQREIDALLRKRRNAAPRCILYARVSSAKQAETGNLNRQKERLLEAARMRGYDVITAITEQASGLNEERRGLRRIFRLAQEGRVDVVLVEYKDRLARFGFAYIEEALAAYGVRVDVLNGPVATDAAQELVQDMLAIVAVFAARLYGARSLKKFRRKVKTAMKEVEALEMDEGLPHRSSEGAS